MTMQSGGIRVRITGDDSDLQNKLKSSGVAVAKWGAAAAAAAAVGGAALIKAGMQSADEQAKLARQLNTTTDALQRTNRAAELAGVAQGQMASATRNLNARLGDAIQGSGAAADAFRRLGLDAQEVANLPLDERISRINQALRDQVSAAERATVAADLYGRQAGQAVSQISADDIEEATRQINRFGGALTDVDAAKIEAANDATSQIGVAFQSVTQQLAVQFSPVLQGVADQIAAAADETDLFGTIGQRAFDIVIKGAGYAADAFRGLQVIVKAGEAAFWGLSTVTVEVFATILRGWDHVSNTLGAGINRLIEGFNKLPGVDIEMLELGASRATQLFERMAETTTDNMRRSAGELHDLLMQPLPSEGLEQWVANVKDAAERAARETVEARKAMDVAALPGIEGEESGATGLTEKERDALENRLQAIRESQMDELEMIAYREDQKREIIDNALANELITAEEHERLMTGVASDGAEARKRIAEAESRARLQMMSQGLGNMAQLMDTESRKLFGIGKAAALSQAVLDGYQSVVSSYAAGTRIGGPVVGAAFAATAGVATAVQIGKIASTSYGSKSYSPATGGGGTNVPSTPVNDGGGATQRTLMVQGDFSADQLFTGDTVRNLMDSIAEQQRNGYTVVV